MLNVANRRCIRRLSLKTLSSARTRNLVAVLAIALTSLLFTSLFTIALSINDGMQQASFRQAGGFAHGTFKRLEPGQIDELCTDPLIEAWGKRLFVGMPEGGPFAKAHVEVSYCDANEAHWMFCDPVEGRLPERDTEAATDTRVLALLGVEPELGAQFTLDIPLDGRTVTRTFTLCGWWNYDEACTASNVLVTQSAAQAMLDEAGVVPPGEDGLTGTWSMDVMLTHGARSIGEDLAAILQNHGYQNETPGDHYIATGVNWGYTGASISAKLDSTTLFLIVGVLALILLTGYLIIYNVFQISVAGDIRFYGLLKTIGTTPRQLRRILRNQALLLAAAGIPVGLLLGWLAGCALAPVVVRNLDSVSVVASANPWIFVGAAVFSLATVLLSCLRPGQMAGRVSPIEAVRYTEGKVSRRGHSSARGTSLLGMAVANLRRSTGKTVLTILSLSLALVLLTFTATLTGGFDLDKFVAHYATTDFVVADATKFQSGNLFSADTALSQNTIDAIQAQGGIAEGGCIYGKTGWIEEFVTEDYYRATQSQWLTPEQLDAMVNGIARDENGLLPVSAQLYGMEDFALDQLKVVEGDLAPLSDPDSHAIAAVYTDDDYGQVVPDSHWARLGDTVTLRYVDEYEYYYTDTGEVIPELNDTVTSGDHPWDSRAVSYRDVQYTVTALVLVPNGLRYRYYGDDAFVLGAEAFIRDTGTQSVMYYTFNTIDDAAETAMESFLHTYTGTVDPSLDYESKAVYSAQFDGIRRMFLLLGGALIFIVGLVGVLNFFNAVVTGITARRRELAVLQAIGMTRRQLRFMLATEGLLYTLSAAVLTLALSLLLGPTLGNGLEHLFWFYTYRLNLLPLVGALPLFAALGILIPLASCHAAARHSVVERLRASE